LGLDFVEGQLANQEVFLVPDDISKEDIQCFDSVGIDDPMVDFAIEGASLEFVDNPDSIDLTIRLSHINLHGELYGEDEDFLDLCPSFDVEIDEFRITGLVFQTRISPWVDENRNLQVDFIDPPELYFDDIVIHLEYISDSIEDLIFSNEFVQDFIMVSLSDLLQEKVPELLQESAFQALFEGDAVGFDYTVGVNDIAIDSNGSNIILDVQVSSALPTAECITELPPATHEVVGTTGLGTNGDLSMLEASVSDALLSKALYTAWRIGYLCFTDEHAELEVFEVLLDGLNAALGEKLQYNVVVGSPPSVKIGANKQITIDIQDFFLEAFSSFSNEKKLLFRVNSDLTANAVLDLNPGTNQLLLTIDTLDVEFSELQSEVLYSDSPTAEEDLKQFITGYVLPRMQNELSQLPVSNALIDADEYLLFIDEMKSHEGHALAGLTIYDIDDPNLDRIAPDTFYTYAPPSIVWGTTKTTVNFDATDDRDGTLAFSYKLDEGAWSTWQVERSVELNTLVDGLHTLSIKSRDRFMNEDETPAVASFEVRAKEHAPTGCSCSLPGSSPVKNTWPSLIALLFAAFFATLRTRQKRSIP